MKNLGSRRLSWRSSFVTGVMLVAAAAIATPALGEGSTVPVATDSAQAPLVTIEALKREEQPGYYRVIDTPDGEADGAVRVYWMPQGTASEAPSDIQQSRIYRRIVAAGVDDEGDVAFYGSGSAAAFAPVDPTGILTAPIFPCFDQYFCIYTEEDFDGNIDYTIGVDGWLDLTWNDDAESAINHRNRDSKLSEHTGGGGVVKCFDSNSSRNLSDGFANEATAYRNRAVDNDC